MTAADAALRFQPRPAEGPLPEMLASLEAEFFVDWQVADLDERAQDQRPTPSPLRPA